jgi:hypothetical protein
MNLAKPKAAAKLQLLANKLSSDLCTERTNIPCQGVLT